MTQLFIELFCSLDITQFKDGLTGHNGIYWRTEKAMICTCWYGHLVFTAENQSLSHARLNGTLEFNDSTYIQELLYIDWLSWGLTTHQLLWVILCRLPERGRKEIEEIVKEMKERDREENGTVMKVKKQKK